MLKHVDSRESESLREQLIELGWEQKQLPIGDYRFSCYGDKIMGIERKEWNDLLSSAITQEGQRGHKESKLIRQLRNLGTDPTLAYKALIIEGTPRVNKHKSVYINGNGMEIPWRMIRNILRSAQDNWNIHIERTIDNSDTVKCIMEMVAHYQKPVHTTLAIPCGDSRISALTLIRGIGSELAMRLFEDTGSLRKIANMTVEELSTIDKIGKGKAKTIKEFFD